MRNAGTCVTTRDPRELKEYLRTVYGYTLAEKCAGITLIGGNVLPMQIIERRKLPPEEVEKEKLTTKANKAHKGYLKRRFFLLRLSQV
jgi:hypothetical protein